MNSSIQFQPIQSIPAQAAVFFAFEDSAPLTGRPGVDQWAAGLYSSGEFTGKLFELAILHTPAGLAANRAILLGAGKAAKLDHSLARKLGGAAVRSLKSKSILTLALAIDGPWQDPAFVQAL
ncbi:MAG: M17 family peptidase N-terminal domain-containing protein, partial [Acidobacteriota bacterium]